jgi:hypothetical protein
MNTENFPERKNRRRKKVLLKFEKIKQKRELSKREQKEYETLTERVEPDRRGERSKKFRRSTI